MKILFFMIILFLTFAKAILIENEATSLDKQMSKLEAMANAKSEAVGNFQTQIQSRFYKNENTETGKKFIQNESVQISSGNIKVVGTPKYRYETEQTTKGTLYTTYIKVRFKLIEKEKIIKKVVKVKQVIHKHKINRKPTKRYKNFRIQITSHNLKDFQKFLFLIPDEKYSKLKFSRTSFSRNSRFYRKYKKYILKFHKNRISKNIKTGKYKMAFLIFDKYFYFKEPNFKTLEFHSQFSKKYSLSNQDFFNFHF